MRGVESVSAFEGWDGMSGKTTMAIEPPATGLPMQPNMSEYS
jgi:hypothetical protein